MHILHFVIVLLYFIYFTCIVLYQKPKKIRILGSYFYLSTFSFAEMANPENTKLCDFTSMNNSDFICTLIAPPALLVLKMLQLISTILLSYVRYRNIRM
jgi:hypothetical protein